MKNKIRYMVVFMLFSALLAAMPAFSQPAFSSNTGIPEGNSSLPLKRLSLFSSGVGFFEHSGQVSGTDSSPFQINLPFNVYAVNDVLKSLTINDPLSNSPSVQYASQDTLNQILKSLTVDLSGNPGIAEILGSLRGAEIELAGSSITLKGRIVGVEHRPAVNTLSGAAEAWLSLATAQGLRSVAVRDIASFSFTDEKINSDLTRALDLLRNSRERETRNLLVRLPGEGSRNVSLSYVIPTPVWKISYRLDISGSEALLQGWAIVDNDSDTDWNNVELSLVTGRPVSFVQNLYAPYRTSRPEIPLAIAGIAESRTYESGAAGGAELAKMAPAPAAAMMDYAARGNVYAMAEESADMSFEADTGYVVGGGIETAAAGAAGDHFEFTFKRPVNLERRQSAMLPLTESSITAEKILVLPGSRMVQGQTINPAISAALVNTSGMRLPAGPITVYDGGTYAGDALIDFFPEDEKRLISYAEDLSVTGSLANSTVRTITGVTISGGVMVITRRQDFEKIYTVRNASGAEKKIIIEHPITSGASLGEPVNFDERTPGLYRFNRVLPANQEIRFLVREEMPLSERITLSQLRPEAFLTYASNAEIPSNVRNALAKAVELRRTTDEALAVQQNLEARLSRLVSEQDRIRRNIEAAGNQSPQGLEYLRRLSNLDAEIDTANKEIDAAMVNVEAYRREYDTYIGGLNLR